MSRSRYQENKMPRDLLSLNRLQNVAGFDVEKNFTERKNKSLNQNKKGSRLENENRILIWSRAKGLRHHHLCRRHQRRRHRHCRRRRRYHRCCHNRRRRHRRLRLRCQKMSFMSKKCFKIVFNFHSWDCIECRLWPRSLRPSVDTPKTRFSFLKCGARTKRRNDIMSNV